MNVCTFMPRGTLQKELPMRRDSKKAARLRVRGRLGDARACKVRVIKTRLRGAVQASLISGLLELRYMCIYAYMICVCIYICIYVYIYKQTRTYFCTYTYIHTYIHDTYMYIYIPIYIYVVAPWLPPPLPLSHPWYPPPLRCWWLF